MAKTKKAKKKKVGLRVRPAMLVALKRRSRSTRYQACSRQKYRSNRASKIYLYLSLKVLFLKVSDK